LKCARVKRDHAILEHILSPHFRYKDRNNPQIIGAILPSEKILDIGCGFKPEVGHSSVKNAVGIDLNFKHGKIMVEHPIIADAQHLPLKKHIFEFVNCQALLEHLPQPHLCMADMRRVMKWNSLGFILIPIDSRQTYQTMKRFLKEFPFSTFQTLKTLWKASTLWKIPGMLHIRQITLQNITCHFRILKVLKKRHEHLWFAHGPFKILRRLGIVNRWVKVDAYAEYYIWVIP
jgi:SAM-dependent methyltransferase